LPPDRSVSRVEEGPLEGLGDRAESAQNLEAAFRASRIRYRELVEGARDVIFTADLDGRITWVNNAAEALLDYTPAELVGMHLLELVVPEEQERAGEILRLVAAGVERDPFEIGGATKHGRRIFVELNTRLVEQHGAPGWIEGIARETTEYRLLKDRLQHQASYDALTGLPNRTLLTERIQQALSRSGLDPAGSSVAVLLLDLDGFMLVNDTLGRRPANEVLTEVARRLESVTTTTETAARLDGDVFAVVAEGMRSKADAIAVAERVLSVFAVPFTIGSSQRSLSASLGVVLSREGAGADELLRDADTAMHRAKRRGRGRFELFGPELRAELLHKAELSSALEAALRDGDLQVHYQPIYSLAGEGEPLAVEALVRWLHPRWGWVAPAEFIPVAEETGLIVPVGRFVISEAARRTASWRQRYPGKLAGGVFVNVSPREISESDFVAFVVETLDEHGLTAADLAFELTERVFIENEDVVLAANVAELARLGIRLVLDDFGTGYSSLSWLEAFPLAAVKIDRLFVSRITGPGSEAPIVKAVIGLARSLGVTVIAEGVESQSQVGELRRLGCDAAQGFLLGRPKSARRTATLIARPAPELERDDLPRNRNAPPGAPASDGRRSRTHIPSGGAEAPVPFDDEARLAALRSYQVLDTGAEAEFDEIALLASQICGTPMAFVSLVDRDREFFKAAVGSDLRESPRATSFCGHTITTQDGLVVPDLADDPRFSDNPNVTGPAGVRFYAGVPLLTHDGFAIGALCVRDTIPRELTDEQLEALRVLGGHVVTQLELRRLLLESRVDAESARKVADELHQISAQYELIDENSSESVFVTDLEGRIVHANPAACRLVGYSEEELVGQLGHELLHHSHADGSPYPREECCFAAEARHIQTDCGMGAGELLWRKDGSSVEIEHVTVQIATDEKPAGMAILCRASARVDRPATSAFAGNAELEVLDDLYTRLRSAESSGQQTDVFAPDGRAGATVPRRGNRPYRPTS